MRTREDVEAYLGRSPYPHRELEDDTWIVRDRNTETKSIAVRLADGLLLFHMKVFDLADVPAASRESLFATLLELNASEMLHGAYGLVRAASGEEIVLTAAHGLEDLDYSEFVATLDDFSVAIAKNHERLGRFRTRGSAPPPRA